MIDAFEDRNLRPHRAWACAFGVLISAIGVGCDAKHGANVANAARAALSDPAPSGSPGAPNLRAPEARGLALPMIIEQARLERDVRRIAKPRVPGSANWRAAQNLCAERFRAAGFEIERQKYATGVNVIGTKPGSTPAQVLVFAHYDHIARCAGADDDASGIAAVLEIARVLGTGKFKNTLTLACWDEEERGLLGSLAYSARARARNQRILAAYSLDAIGFASHAPRSQRVPAGFATLFPEQARALSERNYAADFIAVVGSGSSGSILDSLQRRARATSLPLFSLQLSSLESLLLRDAYRSDHASFWARGYPAVLLTDTANFRNPGYHCEAAPDAPDSLDYEFLQRVTRTTALSAVEFLEQSIQ